MKSFKFLGVEYLVEKNSIKAATRGGATMEFPKPDFEKLNLSGMSSSTFVRYVESHPISGAIAAGIFPALLSHIYVDGKKMFPEKLVDES